MNLLFSLLLLPLLTGCYVSSLAWHQSKLLLSREPVEAVIKSPETTPKIKKKLILTKEILKFASDQGLNTNKAYLHYVHIPSRSVSYTVQASYKDRLEAITWWFPVIGSVPYRGYFSEKERDEKAKELEDEGYDVYKGSVSAFSSLGWFSDPIYEPMLRRSEASLAHLYFHELVHRTFWMPGSTKFNENLAEYIAVVLTEKYLTHKKISLRRYKQRREDKRKYKTWLKNIKKDLNKLYNEKHGDKNELYSLKKEIFHRYITRLKPKFKVYDFIGKKEWNNAYVVASSLYTPNIKKFKKAHSCLKNRNIGYFLKNLEESFKKYKDPDLALSKLCERDITLDGKQRHS